jgi:hypothetical protein
MKKYIFIILTLISTFLTVCKKENELKKSVFIYDPENVDLPAYSEWGYNTFGAYYDREIFISNNEFVPAKIIVSDTSLSFLLDGQKGPSNYYSDNTEMIMSFTLSGLMPAHYADLAMLNDSIIDLTNSACHIIITINSVEYIADILDGELNFNKVQILQVDRQQVEAILSGYFEFKAIINGKAVTISDGRFDVGIGTDNFYNN